MISKTHVRDVMRILAAAGLLGKTGHTMLGVPEIEHVWANALAEHGSGADAVNAAIRAARDPRFAGKELNLPQVCELTRLERARRDVASQVPAPPIELNKHELAAWRRGYLSVIKTPGGTHEDALESAHMMVPRLNRPAREVTAKAVEARLLEVGNRKAVEA